MERAARTCYKSEDKITDTSAERMVKSLIKSGHEAMIEFFDITVKFVTDRGVSHEIVRHRLGSYAQESTRYVSSCEKKHISEGELNKDWIIEQSPGAIRNLIAYAIWLEEEIKRLKRKKA